MTVEIESFRPEHAQRFGELNREWLERYGLMEPSEEEQLADPESYFLGHGGQIFVAVQHGQVIGTCALVRQPDGEVELAKLTVSPDFQGQGIARRLVERCIAYAREQAVRRITLMSNSQLQAAIRLYESMGFQHAPVPAVRKYQIADVSMFLDLDPNTSQPERG